MMSFLTHNMLAVVLVSVLVIGGAWYVFSSGDEKALLTSTVESEAEGTVEKGIVDILLTLRAVSLSGTILSDTAFGTLKDFGTQIVQEPVGRPNPFAPRGATSTKVGDAQTFVPKRP